jgi:glutathione S-transferase
MYVVMGTPKTRTFRVMWMLEELGLPYVLDAKPPRDPAVRAINPTGKVPVLFDDGVPVSDSVAICQYLADKHERLTFKAGTIDRAHQDSFTQFAVDDVESPLWVAAKHSFILPEEYRVAEVKRACRFDFDRAMAAFAERLGSNDYVMGATFTVPDLMLGHCLGWAQMIKWPLPDGSIRAYFDRIRARPAFLKAQSAGAAA